MKIFLGMFMQTVTETQQHNVVLPTIFQITKYSIRTFLNGNHAGKKRLAIGRIQNGRITEGRMIHEVGTE